MEEKMKAGIKKQEVKFIVTDEYREWIEDDKPCLFDISLPEDSLLTPKIKFETGKMRPEIDSSIVQKVKTILSSPAP